MLRYTQPDQPLGYHGFGYLPNITGYYNGIWGGNKTTTNGALTYTYTGTSGLGSNVYQVRGNLSFDAQNSNQIYTNVDRVIPAFISQLYVIKY